VKACRRNGSIDPFIFNLSTRWRQVVKFTHRKFYLQKRIPEFFEYLSVWAPEPT